MEKFEWNNITFHYDDMRKKMLISKKGETDFHLPMESVLRFVAHVLRQKKIREVENITDSKILGMDVPQYGEK